MICIFCDKESKAVSIEHIVPESLGNKYYTMSKGTVCDTCNRRFSQFESTALNNSILAMERARFGIKTKKGKNVKGKINELKIQGDENFRKEFISVKGLNPNNFKYNPETKEGSMLVKTFDKSEVAVSKLLLKMGLESICRSQRILYQKYDFSELKDFITTKNNLDWPFLTTNYENNTFYHIPNKTQRRTLDKIRCYLTYLRLNEKSLLFKFKYGTIPFVINLLNRDLDWIRMVKSIDSKADLHPDHFRKKILHNKGNINKNTNKAK